MWKEVALDQVCDVEFGTRVVKKKDGGSIYPVYGGGGATFSMDEYNREDRLVVARFAMSEQCTRFVEGRFFLNDSGLTVSAKDSGRLYQRFLDYHLLALNDTIYSLGKGTAQKNLESDAFRKLTLSIPDSVPEQQRIVTKLDAAFVALREAEGHVERNRANARELFESYLNGVFEGKEGWVTRPLSEFIHVKHGFAFLGEHFTQSGDYVLLTMGNFFESGGYRDRGEKQKYYVGPIPEEFVLSQGDLVVAMTEQAAGLLGAPLLVPESGKFLHNQRIGLVQQPNGVVVLNEFLFHIFNTKPFRDAVHASGSGVKVRHTSPTKIGEVEVSYPTSLNEQRRIVDALASLEKETKQLEATYQQKLRELEMLKKSVLGAAFSGEL
ncbi:MAG: restriction endonuclease subunit S [Flavobacteriales bacterium]|nr:MAG: restriction endonuclease subunit S [Flavobacteriales bacterium]